MASNKATLADPQGQFDDWIELYNPGNNPVSVAGLYLTDDRAVPRKWQFPPRSVNATTIGAKGYLLVWADGDVSDPGLHASFRLGSDGDQVYLYGADGVTLIDSLKFGPQTADVSFGRYPDGDATLQFFSTPTPGKANTPGYVGEVAPLEFSHERGFYDSPFDVTIRTATPDAQVLYSIDGRIPNDSSGYRMWPGRTYSGPLHVASTTCLRAIALKPGWKPTAVYTHTYVFDSRASIQSLPAISLVGDPGKVFYEPNGIMAIVGGTYAGGVWASSGVGSYNNMLNRELERPVSLEWLYPTDDSGFQIDGGLRVHGSPYMRPRYVRQNGQWSGSGKISFRVYFRGEYGQSRLDYALIPFSDVEQFATLVLRAGHNDPVNPFIKDELLRRLYKDMGQASCVGTFANLFIDGEYKGYYNPTEQVKEESCQQWFDSDRGWDVMTMNGLRDGDSVSWNAMLNYARTHNLADPTYYAEMGRKLDIPAFIDYLIIRLWPNDWDWPQNNWSAACERSPTGRWQFFVWDAEGTFETGQIQLNRFSELNAQSSESSVLYRALKASPDFRMLFADRLYRHFFNGGTLTDSNVQKRFYELSGTLRSVIPSMDSYIVNTWTPTRRPIFLDACKKEGVYTFAGPTFFVNNLPQYGGQVAAGDRLFIVPTEGIGTIYYTLDGSDPAQAELQNMPITTTPVPRDATKRVLVPTGPVTGDWRSIRSFDDSSWLLSSGAPGGLGFGRGAGFEPYVTTNLTSRMLNVNSSCYVRIPFRFDGDKSQVTSLTLNMQYDDGFVAYLNGTEIARRNFTGDPVWNSAATVSRSNTDVVVFEAIDVSPQATKLRQGDNILAIQGLNSPASNTDFLLNAELVAVQTPPSRAVAGRQVYTGPLTLTHTTRVKARVMVGGTPSALAEAVFAVGPVKESLRISEIMYRPADTGVPGDPNTEYIELTNIGPQPIDLGFVRFTQGVRFTFPEMQLAPHAFCLVVKDRAAFEACYGSELPVVGEYTGSLNDNGERIELRDAAGAVIHDFRYDNKWFRETDGLGYSLTVRYPATVPVTAWSTPGAWRSSVAPGGSPGSDDSGTIPGDGAIVINELSANPLSGESDWVELYNTTSQAIDLSGWFLSDSVDDLTKYEIAPGTLVRPHACLLLTESQHFGNPQNPGCREPFGFSKAGESVYLSSGSQGHLTGYREQAHFGASDSGLTFGRYVDSAGGAQLVPLFEPTPGQSNADPVVGPVVITEIMYHTEFPGDTEYVELLNTGSTVVTLYDSARQAPWRLTSGGIEFLLPDDPVVSLAPHAYLLLVKDRASFLARYAIPVSVSVMEWGAGTLGDAGDAVELSRPGDPDNDTPTWIVVDRVTYSNGSHPENFPGGVDPWPNQAAGRARSLARTNATRWGDDPAVWLAATPSVGSPRARTGGR